MDDGYPYNDDLLRTPGDQERARAEYGPIAFALHFPAMLERFEAADNIANNAKQYVRRMGLRSVAAVTLALLVASAAPLYRNYHWSDAVVFAAALLGIGGGLVGLGLRSAAHKAKWLENRLVTERLRHLHFRLLIVLAPAILDAAESGDWTHFEANRAAALGAFEQDVIKRKESELEAIIEACADPPPANLDENIKPACFDKPNGALLLKAYRNLRIVRQLQFADYKLLKKGGLFSPFARTQASVLSVVGYICIFLLLALHISFAFLSTLGVSAESLELLDVVAIWTAFIALALRTIEEGLKPRAEVERYRHYQATVKRILEQFDRSDLDGKLSAAVALEHASFDEMAIFLRSNSEARFTM
ncbi:MAG TPA: hypothetical protein VGF56_08830 [Rhizomicrobium sp.]|jgi:hypothetical protein